MRIIALVCAVFNQFLNILGRNLIVWSAIQTILVASKPEEH